MAAPVCELCGGTDFVKADGMFVCQGCSTKYTLEEAQKLMQPNGAAAQTAPARSDADASFAQDELLARELQDAAEFQPQAIRLENGDARSINNYVCTGFRLLLQDYEALDHPGKPVADELLSKARQCVTLLDAACSINPNDHVGNLLIVKNCARIEDEVQQLKYYEKDDEGNWDSDTFFFEKVRPAGQNSSWDEKARYHRDFIEQEFVDVYTLEWQRKLELENKARELQADIDDLKDEKRSKGFFNFAEKREVKDRMKPVKEELSIVRSHIREIERKVDRFVDDKLDTLEGSYVSLS